MGNIFLFNYSIISEFVDVFDENDPFSSLFMLQKPNVVSAIDELLVSYMYNLSDSKRFCFQTCNGWYLFLNFSLEGNTSFIVHEGWQAVYLDGVTSSINLPASELSNVSFTVALWVLTSQSDKESILFTSHNQLEIKLKNMKVIAQLMKTSSCCLVDLTGG